MSPIRILVAEDDTRYKCSLARALRRLGHGIQTVCVSSDLALLEHLANPESPYYECVVLDYALGDTPASELLPRISHLTRSPVLVCSSSDDQSVVIDCLRAGATDFIPRSNAIDGVHVWHRIEEAILNARHSAERRRRMERRVRLAEVDPLTHLPNRRALQRWLNHRRKTLDRRGNVSVVLLDLDHFKSVNDTFGHDAGDRVLRRVASLLRNSVQDCNIVGRYGGEEFVVIFWNATLAEVFSWTEQLRAELQAKDMHDSESDFASPTASFGIACHGNPQSFGELVRAADDAMYLAKRRGRNRVCTAEMAHFQALAQEAKRGVGHDPESAIHRFVSLSLPSLGPAQRMYVTDHAKYVSATAQAIAGRLGLRPDITDCLRLAGLGHDTGKCVVPENVLAKRGMLSPAEWTIVRMHAEESAQILTTLGAPDHAVKSARHHHVRFDGTSTLPGENAICAQTLAVADAFAAITESRPYKAASPLKDALIELARHRGTQFAPEPVNALIGLVADNEVPLPHAEHARVFAEPVAVA